MLEKIIKLLTNYKHSLTYILLITLINTLFCYIPLINVFGSEVSPMDWTVGLIYVFRDFAQRELQHKVIFAMFIGGILSFGLADKALAVASMSAFIIAEFIDWGIYTYTRRPLSQRILWSATISSPIDSIVFLLIINQFNWLGVTILSLAKIGGVLFIWYWWRIQDQRSKSTCVRLEDSL